MIDILLYMISIILGYFVGAIFAIFMLKYIFKIDLFKKVGKK